MTGERSDIRVDQSALRCPYCHDDVDPTAEWLACAGCLARHHPACWDEGAACANCGGAEHLVRPGEAAGREQAAPAREVAGPGLDADERRLLLGLLGSTALLVGGGALLGALVGGLPGALVGAVIGLGIILALLGGGLAG